jgi:hypothetical protein
MAGRKPSLQPEGPSWQQLTVAIAALRDPASEQQLATLCSLLAQFTAANEDARTSPNLLTIAPDSLEPLVAMLARPDVACCPGDILLLALKALKVLARRQDVRLRCTQRVLDVVAPLLEPAAGGTAAGLASEAANALSNLCYEPANCSGLLRAGGVARLLTLLAPGGAGPEAHLNAAGALQTLSFQPDGRAALLKASGAAALLRRLASSRSSSSNSSSSSSSSSSSDSGGAAEGGSVGSDGKLRHRLAGALHNLSSSAEGITAIRQLGGTAALAQLLASPHAGVALAAAGALQNMSREAEARAEIRARPDAVASLASLLIGPDTQARLGGRRRRGMAIVCTKGRLAVWGRPDGCIESPPKQRGGSLRSNRQSAPHLLQAAECAAGTLANLAAKEGPPDGGDGGGISDALTQALADALAGGAIYHSLGASQQPTAAATLAGAGIYCASFLSSYTALRCKYCVGFTVRDGCARIKAL